MKPDILFDHAKPFYPFIMSYFAATHGYNDLIARKLVDQVALNGVPVEVPKDELARLDRFKGASKTPLIVEKFEFQAHTGKPVEVVISEVEDEVYENVDYLSLPALKTPLRMLILSCYEVVKDEYDSSDPEWQFFRHVRNAAAHNGKFDIRAMPQHPVKWSGKEITAAIHGIPLFHDTDRTQSFLMPGDILMLLRDIEAKVQPLPM